MPYIKILVHLIWSTKNEQKIISDQMRPGLMSCIREGSIKQNIFIDTINPVDDHIHILISFQPDQLLSQIVHIIKRESANWINQNKFSPEKFEWEDDYMALSVSESDLAKVRKYISNQQQQHLKKSFHSEVNLLLKKSGYKRNTEGYAPAPVFIPR